MKVIIIILLCDVCFAFSLLKYYIMNNQDAAMIMMMMDAIWSLVKNTQTILNLIEIFFPLAT